MIKGGDSHGAYEQGSDRDRGSPGHRQGHRRTAGEGWNAGGHRGHQPGGRRRSRRGAGRAVWRGHHGRAVRRLPGGTGQHRRAKGAGTVRYGGRAGQQRRHPVPEKALCGVHQGRLGQNLRHQLHGRCVLLQGGDPHHEGEKGRADHQHGLPVRRDGRSGRLADLRRQQSCSLVHDKVTGRGDGALSGDRQCGGPRLHHDRDDPQRRLSGRHGPHEAPGYP